MDLLSLSYRTNTDLNPFLSDYRMLILKHPAILSHNAVREPYKEMESGGRMLPVF